MIARIPGAASESETVQGRVVARTVRFRSQREQVKYLRQVVDEFSGHPVIRQLARDIVFRQFHVPPNDQHGQAIALATWVQDNVRYIREMPEVFQSPESTLHFRSGDCDDHVTLTLALCQSVGIRTRIDALEWDAPDPGGGIFGLFAGPKRALQHIFGRAIVPTWRGMRAIPLDTTLPNPVSDLVDPYVAAVARGLRVTVVSA